MLAPTLAAAGLFALSAAALAAQAPPPSPAAESAAAVAAGGAVTADASAWACTRKTLLDQAPCTVEGRTAPSPASKEQAKENQRQAKVLADDVCARLSSQSGAPEPDAALLSVCAQRATTALKRCGGDGSRRLVDDAGRINPGHATCYAALAGLVRDMSALVDTAAGCCTCVHDACNGSAEQCLVRMADDKPPETSQACLAGVCAEACAQAKLFAPVVAAPGAARSSSTSKGNP